MAEGTRDSSAEYILRAAWPVATPRRYGYGVRGGVRKARNARSIRYMLGWAVVPPCVVSVVP